MDVKADKKPTKLDPVNVQLSCPGCSNRFWVLDNKQPCQLHLCPYCETPYFGS